MNDSTASHILVARAADGQLLCVESFSDTEVQARVLSSKLESFAELVDSASEAPLERYALEQLTLPLPSRSKTRSLGIGLSYQDHRDDVAVQTTVIFEKNASPTRLSDPVPYREYLDYETEVSLLLHRNEPTLFGYLMHNDLSDRSIQVENFDAKNLGPGFSKAKSFERANAHGTLMAVGDANLWKKLRIRFRVNGEARQQLDTSLNILTPEGIHARVFEDSTLSQDAEWVVIGTGTPIGTVFRAPTLVEKLALVLRAGFSQKRARKLWLASFSFLQPGDVLEFHSEILGRFTSRVEVFD
ncbi:MAG: fumarylacetoacetate hydrolase family protein [Bdellovibrionota bacterium]